MPTIRPTEDSRSIKARAERNKRLKNSDWTQLADSKVKKAAWAKYRQELRDIPQQIGYPENIEWPKEPD